MYALATVVWTFGEILMATNVKVYVAEHTPINFRGRINAVYLFLKAGMNALGVLLSGRLIGIAGHSKIWIYVIFASLFLSVCLLIDNWSDLKAFDYKKRVSNFK